MIRVVFFFFKPKTAYEMRISDWSSDVCSSDLQHADLVESIHHIGDRTNAVHHIALDVLGRIKIRLLRQIADLDAFGGPGLTLIILVVTGNDLHQGGLARTVDADDGDLRARQELQGNIVENGLVRSREGQIGGAERWGGGGNGS